MMGLGSAAAAEEAEAVAGAAAAAVRATPVATPSAVRPPKIRLRTAALAPGVAVRTAPKIHVSGPRNGRPSLPSDTVRAWRPSLRRPRCPEPSAPAASAVADRGAGSVERGHEGPEAALGVAHAVLAHPVR